ncbi:hypothetical protein TNIN_498901 [Trichonephila inaurata madagascariensis]|uniref:Uncharacterized protein n=1 Tax=Trichonephila inaurata madagascariensis TaxID=2747483 RepID=A0A8X6WQY7_9ARAC|nr:hypothetical protein TNIN_498901 [Trichonephila inaurata madagascariensis]
MNLNLNDGERPLRCTNELIRHSEEDGICSRGQQQVANKLPFKETVQIDKMLRFSCVNETAIVDTHSRGHDQGIGNVKQNLEMVESKEMRDRITSPKETSYGKRSQQLNFFPKFQTLFFFVLEEIGRGHGTLHVGVF